MALMAISTSYMCFRRASDSVYSCMSSTASSRVILTMSFPVTAAGTGESRRERNPAGQLAVEADLESILARARQGNVEHQHRSGLHGHHSSRRLAELDGALSSQQLVSPLVNEANSDGVHPDLGAAAPYQENQVG